MRYLLLIYTPEQLDAGMAEASADEFAAYGAFTRDIRERGLYEAGEALHPTTSATTVRVRDGQTITTDGPFAETKEALGGFYLINARDLDEAIDAAAKIPGAQHGSIEVRPIFEYSSELAAAGSSSAGASN
ncbi:MAG TPA: YciI family protein [Candidatus Limnocylindrales bacterium]|nr:YciI family protein [Candidatus Limnocylindrales bacterium]